MGLTFCRMFHMLLKPLMPTTRYLIINLALLYHRKESVRSHRDNYADFTSLMFAFTPSPILPAGKSYFLGIKLFWYGEPPCLVNKTAIDPVASSLHFENTAGAITI